METNTSSVNEGLLITSEVADILRLSTRQIERMVKRRQLPYYKFGHSIRFKRADIIARIDSQNRVEKSGRN